MYVKVEMKNWYIEEKKYNYSESNLGLSIYVKCVVFRSVCSVVYNRACWQVAQNLTMSAPIHTQETDDQLIDMWEAASHLYDQTEPDYANRGKKYLTLAQFGTELGLPGSNRNLRIQILTLHFPSIGKAPDTVSTHVAFSRIGSSLGNNCSDTLCEFWVLLKDYNNDKVYLTWLLLISFLPG